MQVCVKVIDAKVETKGHFRCVVGVVAGEGLRELGKHRPTTGSLWLQGAYGAVYQRRSGGAGMRRQHERWTKLHRLQQRLLQRQSAFVAPRQLPVQLFMHSVSRPSLQT